MSWFKGVKDRVVSYLKENEGPNRAQRQAMEAKSKRAPGASKHGGGRTKTLDYYKLRHKRRLEQKRRRKQRWRGR